VADLKLLLLIPIFFALAPSIQQDNSAKHNAAAQTSDQEIAEFARKLLENQRATDAELRAGIKTIQSHVFKDTNAPEKEYALYAQGTLEDRTNQPTRAVVSFRRFERTYPNSPYMPEVNFFFGRYALNQKKYKDAESRFSKVIDSDSPAESKFNAQGLLVWCLLEQKRMEEAIPIVQTIFPIDKSKPDERAFVAIIEAQCEAKALDAARKTRNAYVAAFRNGTMKHRVHLAWGMLLGESGQSVECARALREVIRAAPASEEADEARLAIATIIADGKLPSRSNPSKDTPESLIAQLRTEGTSGNVNERAYVLQLRMVYDDKQWNQVISMVNQFLKYYPGSTYTDTVQSYKTDSIRAIFQGVITDGGPFAAMPLLTVENISLITPELRASLVTTFVSKGLPEAATKLIEAAPENEKNELRKALTKNIPEPLPPPKVLASLNGNLLDRKGELGQVQILLSAKKWSEATVRIEKLDPGTDRIKAVLAVLTRPMASQEIQLRIKEAEGWLAKCPESDQLKEPLIIYIADLYMQTNNPTTALALYPTQPQPENLGWVALMRASAMLNLGRREEAKRILNENDSVPEFKIYRQAMANQLNR
jgi:TolA-binding protein